MTSVLLLALALASGERSAVGGSAITAPSQTAPLAAPRAPVTAEPGSELRVYLLTFGLGAAPWERFGHNAIRIQDTLAGTDTGYDWGRFDFREVNFIYNFARGQMRYWMDSASSQAYIEGYTRFGRKIWMQELEIPPGARLALKAALARNLQPEHRHYDYDYYLDNCSTRIRDALDVALGGSLKAWGIRPSGVTWRQDTRRLNQHNPLLYTALMIGLGRRVDREMRYWDQMFLPVRLRELLDSVQTRAPDGSLRPAVRSGVVLVEADRFPEPAVPADWTLRYLVVGVLTGGIFAGLGLMRHDPSGRGRAARRALMALGTLWAMVSGITGAVLVWLWAFSRHVAAYDNENVLLFNVLALALAIVLPPALRERAWAVKPARRLALVIAAMAALGLVLKLIPGAQANLELIALVLPAHAGLALGVSYRPAA